jgi:hypothetical protein
MELRTLVLILAAPLSLACASPVQRHALDDRALYPVRIGTGAPTTITFPGPITAIEGANISTKAEDQPPVLISHHAESSFFSVRALRPEASAAINVIYRGKVFAFTFTASDAPDRTLTFHEQGEPSAVPVARRPGVARLLSLLDRARNIESLAEQYPALTQRIARHTPNTTTVAGTLSCTMEEILGFPEEDAVVLRVRLENRGTAPLRYYPARLSVLVNTTRFPSALNDASGEIPPGRAEILHVVIVGQPTGGPAHLSVKNPFTLALPLHE